MSFSAESALEYLELAHKKNRLAHAYLISGPAGSGKSEVAARLAALLNKTTPEKVLQTQAANAFLKTLEEPPQNSLLLLLSALPEALPETIVSRCLSLPLRSSSEAPLSPQEKELLRLLCTTA